MNLANYSLQHQESGALGRMFVGMALLLLSALLFDQRHLTVLARLALTLDELTQQNAAMVEQGSASGISMGEQAQRRVAAVKVFSA